MGWVNVGGSPRLLPDHWFGQIVSLETDGSAIVRPIVGRDAMLDLIGVARLGSFARVGALIEYDLAAGIDDASGMQRAIKAMSLLDGKRRADGPWRDRRDDAAPFREAAE